VYVPFALNPQKGPKRLGPIPEAIGAVICPIGRRRYERLNRRLRNRARFCHMFAHAVPLLRRGPERSVSRAGSLLGYERDWREQGDNCQREDATSHSSLPRAILHQDGWGPRVLTQCQRFGEVLVRNMSDYPTNQELTGIDRLTVFSWGAEYENWA
jgi:hypothetical protein